MSIQTLPVALAAAPGLPAQIGKYAVRARLGEGATSEVFLAYDEFKQRNVAIKRSSGACSIRTWSRSTTRSTTARHRTW